MADSNFFQKYCGIIVIGFACLMHGFVTRAADRHDSAVIYEIFVDAFADSDHDGKGDLKGLENQLNYFTALTHGKQTEFPVNTLLLMPIFPSPGRDGYDPVNFFEIRKSYGTMEAFQHLIDIVHEKNMHILLDIPLNQTSDQHVWFQAELNRTSLTGRERYIWRKTKPEDWIPVGENPTDEVWFPAENNFYYYAVTGPDRPDLNWKNKDVQTHFKRVLKFWLDMGLDGFRFSFCRYLTETGPQNGQMDVEPTLHILSDLTQYVHSVNKNALVVLDTTGNLRVIQRYRRSAYPIDGLENSETGNKIIQAVIRENPDIIRGYREFLRNDTGEKTKDVTFISSRRWSRIADTLPLSHRKKLAAEALLTLPGIPKLFYGEEIGMHGSLPQPNILRRFCRTRYSARYCRTVNLDQQMKNSESLWHTYSNLLRLRKKFSQAFTNAPVHWIRAIPEDKVLAFRRGRGSQLLIIVMNFHHFPVRPILPVDPVLADVKAFRENISGRIIQCNALRCDTGYRLDPLPPGDLFVFSIEKRMATKNPGQ